MRERTRREVAEDKVAKAAAMAAEAQSVAGSERAQVRLFMLPACGLLAPCSVMLAPCGLLPLLLAAARYRA